jgi:hypothetical protein
VTIDFNVMVELTWKIPNLAAIKENRVDSPDTVARNLSIAPGINYKQVEQVRHLSPYYKLCKTR